MASKTNQQQNAMVSLAKSRNMISLPEKKDTWGNLLNKKCTNTNTVISLKKKPLKNLSNSDRVTKTISKSIQCDLLNNYPGVESCQNSNSLFGLSPIRTLQFLLKEIMKVPNVEKTGITKIVNEMQVVIERINNECSKNSKLFMPIIDDSNMIPTRENDYLTYDNNLQENKYWLVLLEKISQLESNYSQLNQNYTNSGEKLQNLTSERDKLLEKFKESCDLLEKLNNREREYLNTITELKAKVITSEKLICKQEAIIINLNNKLNNLSNKSPELANEKMSSEHHNLYKTVLKEKNQFKQNCNQPNFSMDKLKFTDNFRNSEVSKFRSDIQEMKQIVLAGLENPNLNSVSITSIKPDGNQKTDLLKCNADNKYDIEYNIDTQYTEYNRQASAIKLSKVELQQLFQKIESQAYHSKNLFNSTFVDFEKDLNDISDEENNHSNIMSVVTDSSC